MIRGKVSYLVSVVFNFLFIVCDVVDTGIEPVLRA